MSSREWLRCVLGEHRDNDVVDYLDFSFIRSRHFYEYISGIKTDFGMIPVDDWWH